MTKFIWSYLRDQGVVSFSTRQIAAATGTSRPAVAAALKRLRVLELLEDRTPPRPRTKPTFRVVG